MIKPINSPSFGYSHFIKNYWVEGKLPTVTKGLYGGTLTKDTVTLEHIIPHSKGGKTVLTNLALSKDVNNWKRGNNPIEEFLKPEMLEQYLEQFKGIKLPKFNGDEYARRIIHTVRKALEEGK